MSSGRKSWSPGSGLACSPARSQPASDGSAAMRARLEPCFRPLDALPRREDRHVAQIVALAAKIVGERWALDGRAIVVLTIGRRSAGHDLAVAGEGDEIGPTRPDGFVVRGTAEDDRTRLRKL